MCQLTGAPEETNFLETITAPKLTSLVEGMDLTVKMFF